MGSWGYEPLDSDTSLDWVDNTAKILADRIETTLKKSGAYPEEVRAAAHYIVSASENDFLSDYDVLGLIPLAIEKLNKILENKKWIDEWNSTKDIKSSIKNQIKILESLKNKVRLSDR